MPLTSAKSIYQQVTDAVMSIYDEREAESLAVAYLSDRWHIDRIKLRMNIELAVDEQLLKGDLRKLQQGMPLQHVVGFQEFYSHRFQTNHHALIPRPETEELVEWVLEEIKHSPHQTLELLDIGTGTGCIPISIDLESEHVQCTGIDISEDALKLAETNAKRLHSDTQFKKLDILADQLKENSFDFIVSNPPYIPESDKGGMHHNVLNYEPGLALFVSNEDPLIFYRTIAQKALTALTQNGTLFFEIHEAYGKAVMKLLDAEGYQEVEMRQDINGKDRMIRAQR